MAIGSTFQNLVFVPSLIKSPLHGNRFEPRSVSAGALYVINSDRELFSIYPDSDAQEVTF